MVMTASPLLGGRMLIPGAFELNAPPHREKRAAELVSAPSPVKVRSVPAANAPNVVAAPARPASRLGYAASILWDLALVMALIYGVAVVPALAVWGVRAAISAVSPFDRGGAPPATAR
jgi:hypothetical protein